MHFHTPAAEAVFAEYEARHSAEIERMRTLQPSVMGLIRDEFLLPVGKEVGIFLHALIRARRPARILELGTSYGYSTLFLADAAWECGARVTSIDLERTKQDYARDMLERAGLAGQVEFRTGDALELVGTDPGPFDLVLLDIWKDLYVPCFEGVYPKLAEEAVLISDNMIHPAGARESARALRAAIGAKPDLQTVLLPIGQGVELTVKWSKGNASL